MIREDESSQVRADGEISALEVVGKKTSMHKFGS